MNNKRYQDIYGAVQSEVRDTSSSFQTIAKRYVNDGYEEILRRLIQANVVEQFRTFSLTTTAGTRSYPTPPDFGEVVYCTDTTNARNIEVISEKELYEKNYQYLNTTGVPMVVVPRSESNFMRQPATSNAIRVVSSDAADTSQSVFLRGISGSAEYYETVALNGTTSASSSNMYDYLLEATKSATTTGKITLTYITDNAVASIMSPESLLERYKVLEFFFVPSGAFTYSIRYRRMVKPMTQDNDTPIVDIASGIEFFAIARAWEYKRQFMTATHFMNKFEAWYTQYVADNAKSMVNKFDFTPYPRTY